MKAVKSERGMILVTILMLIVIFSIVGITIINFTVTNAKQTSNIKKDMQSVDIAEMGIIRYRSELLNKMNDVLTIDIYNAIKAIEETNKTKNKDFIPINSATVFEKMVTQGAFSNPYKFHLGYTTEIKHLIASHPDYSYIIVENPIDIAAPEFPEIIKITMISKGFSGEDTNEIEAEFSYNIVDIINTHLIPGTIVEVEKNSAVLIEKPVIELLENGQNLPEVNCNTGWLQNRCVDNNAKNPIINGHINGVEGALSGNVTLVQGDINVADSKLYMKSGQLTVGTVERISNAKLHSSGNITFNNSNKGGFEETEISGKNITFGTIKVFNNNKVYAEGNVQFDNINTSNNSNWKGGGIFNSVIYSTGNITFENINEGFVKSSVYAGGNLIIKNLNGQSHINDTKIRVYGNLKVGVINTLIQNNSMIWVDGNIDTGNVNGQAIDHSSFICAKGNIDKNLIDKALVVGKDAEGNDIKNIQANVKSFEHCGMATQIGNESRPSTLEPILSSLKNAQDQANYLYK